MPILADFWFQVLSNTQHENEWFYLVIEYAKKFAWQSKRDVVYRTGGLVNKNDKASPGFNYSCYTSGIVAIVVFGVVTLCSGLVKKVVEISDTQN